MCTAIDILASLAIGYAIGSIPVGYLFVRLKKNADIRETGSGSTGATNVARVLGKKTAFFVALLDAIKGIAAFYVATSLVPSFQFSGELAALFAVIGHCFPVWLGFRGGKGVSTAFGATLVIARLSALAALIIFLYSLGIARRVSVASLCAVWSFCGFVFIFDTSLEIRITGLILAAFITFTHKQNIKRIIEGNEQPIFGKT